MDRADKTSKAYTTTFLQLNNSLRQLLRRFEVDRAIVYGFVANTWSVVSGPVTMFLIATRLSSETQGFYYTFGSVLGLQFFVELSLSTVIIQFASHEWSKLGLNAEGQIEGESESLSRLASLGKLSIRWYLIAGVVVAFGLSLGGYIFFSQSTYPGIDWISPWIFLSILTGINFCLIPAWALLQGCGQVVCVYNFKMIEGFLRALSIWAALALGGGLWTPGVSVAVCIIWAAMFLTWRYRRFFLFFFLSITGPHISWWNDVWPMQWRMALSSVGGYFIAYFFTPVLFYYHGAVVAGQMGMTWALASVVAAITSLWSATRAPKFGMLVAKKEYQQLDRLFSRVVTASIAVLITGAIAIWLLIYLLYTIDFPLSVRLLPPLPTGLFLLGMVAMNATVPLATYLRAHKKEPFLVLSVVSGLLIGLFVWLLGSRFSAVGAGAAYMMVSVLFTLPYAIVVWHCCRAAWHSDTL